MFDAEFFPTPKGVAKLMLAKISKDAMHFLEPSAGKGDLAEAIRGDSHDGYDRGGRYSNHHRNVKVDCIEQSPELASVLLGKDLAVIGYDWLTYSGVCYYDAIVMNPPFANGDDHLLKAWDFMHDGEIVCLLNEETILNPYTAQRKRLAKVIEEHGTVEYLGDCFTTAQRKTDVRVAMVYLKKVSQDDSVELWATEGGTEKEVDESTGPERAMLAIRDGLGNMEHYYNMANEHMLKAFQHMRKASLYMEANHIGSGGEDYGSIVRMGLGNLNAARAEYIRKHRKDAWLKVFEKMEFRKWLDKKQTDEFIRDIERNSNIQFTADNIKGTLENVFSQRSKLFEMSVWNVFEELTRYFKGNSNHHEGWKTNDSYKVNRKLIFPYGCTFDNKYTHNFSMRWGGQMDIYSDLDRVMCVLDGCDFTECSTIGSTLDYRFRKLGSGVKAPFDNTAHSQYFDIRFFKKGTVHLFFKDEGLWEKFNITAAKGRAWLGEDTRGKADREEAERKKQWDRERWEQDRIKPDEPDAEVCLCGAPMQGGVCSVEDCVCSPGSALEVSQ